MRYFLWAQFILCAQFVVAQQAFERFSDSAQAYVQRNEFSRAVDWQKKHLAAVKKTGKHELIMFSESELGSMYYSNFDFAAAAQHYFNALKIAQARKDKKYEADYYNAIGCVYYAQAAYDKAKYYFLLSLKTSQQEKPRSLHGSNYSYLAGILYNQQKYDSSLLLYNRAIDLYTQLNDTFNLLLNKQNIAGTYIQLNQHEKALQLLNESIVLAQQLNSPGDVGYGYFTLGLYFTENKNYKLAAQNFEKGATEFQKINDYGYLSNCLLGLSDALNSSGDYKQAMEYYKKYVQFRDSVYNKEQTQEITKREVSFQFEKKQLADSIKNIERQKEIQLRNNEKLKRQQLFTWFGLGGFALMILVAVLLFRNLKNKARANTIIEQQKKEVEFKNILIETRNKEITDSITYAQRLQKAILAPESEINRFIEHNFLLYKPKDIVAGDFYFFEVTPTHIFYAAADCTGHGVPGAMVSIVCSNALTRCVKEFQLTEPGKILDKARILILETFEKSGQDVKDGMDISLMAIERDSKNKRVQKFYWAGANNPLWLITSKNGEKKFTEIKPDKQPIGKTDDPKPFTTHTLPIEDDSQLMVYLFTDGYADQFGGPKGKKFKYSTLQEILIENSHQPMRDQHLLLEQKFEAWKGDLEQLDDVCIIGLSL